ncbi:MAG TPA: C2H2-type zinc finger protein [Candidatus Nitrosotenuis sp.]|nr:C2H2-type zinc finger protein [Candidatus Nitrosotenuis sp.]
MKLFKRIKCEECGRHFPSEENLMQHQQIVHGKDLPYDCKICNQNFSNMQDMRTHLQRHHSYKN